MIFLDTDVISYFLKGNNIIKGKIRKAIESGEKVCITSINLYEILKGLKRRDALKKEEKFLEFVELLDIYTLNEISVGIAAKIYADLTSAGQPIGDADIRIASIVMENNSVLVTNNVKHYERISKLCVENWLK